MPLRLNVPWCLGVALVVSLLAACGDSTEGDADTAPAPAASTTTTSTPTTDTVASTTAASTTLADKAELSNIEPPGEGEPWDIVFFGFDDVFTRLPGELYADQLTEALGVEMRLFEPPGFDYVWAATLVEQLRGDRYPPLGDYVPPAEVIVLLSRPGESPDGEDEHIVEDFERCWWRPLEGEPPASNLTDDYWAVYRHLLDEVYTEIWNLRQDQPTLLITMDLYNPSLQKQREGGIDEACITWFESWRDQIARAAESHGSVFVSLQDAFNGADHQFDPAEAGLIGQSETDPSAPWYRNTPLGVSLQAEALVAASLEALNTP